MKSNKRLRTTIFLKLKLVRRRLRAWPLWILRAETNEMQVQEKWGMWSWWGILAKEARQQTWVKIQRCSRQDETGQILHVGASSHFYGLSLRYYNDNTGEHAETLFKISCEGRTMTNGASHSFFKFCYFWVLSSSTHQQQQIRLFGCFWHSHTPTDGWGIDKPGPMTRTNNINGIVWKIRPVF